MKIIETGISLREQVNTWRIAGEKTALVPTMGALHAGHISLVTEAKLHASRVIVSIFVNPTQFAPNEDFSKYPRTFESDCALLKAAGVDCVFFPSVNEMYPQGFVTEVNLLGVAKAGLEDKFRPTHFTGVATVVLKLLNLADSDFAIFGEKDYQQLLVIKQMARDVNHKTEIIGAETLREEDGLAMSSRNRYLSKEERETARLIIKTLKSNQTLDEKRQTLTKAGFLIDYLEERDALNLAEITASTKNKRLLIAAKLGNTRLIDNIGL